MAHPNEDPWVEGRDPLLVPWADCVTHKTSEVDDMALTQPVTRIQSRGLLASQRGEQALGRLDEGPRSPERLGHWLKRSPG
jgi:hypothetical protein